MLQTLRNAWKVEEIRKKILFTLLIVLLYRLGNAIPVPYVNVSLLQNYFDTVQNTVLGLLDVMSGGAFSTATIFALSIQPYINASIIIQLLCIAIPALERLSKDEGEEGRKKIASITRYATVGIGLLQGFGYYMLIKNNNFLVSYAQNNIWAAIVIILTFTSGSALIMWLGEQITEFGIGNGISIILFVNILSSGFATAETIVNQIKKGGFANIFFAILSVIIMVAVITLVVFITNSERRIPVQYAKRVVGRKMYGGQNSNLPLKLNMSGVMPIIFASSIVSLPTTIGLFVQPKTGSFWAKFLDLFSPSSVVYVLLFIALIIAFSYFYIEISFNNVEVANNLKKNGGFIPGFRAGKPTSEFIQKVLNKITLFGAIYLSVIAITPLIISACSQAEQLTGISLGGTSIIIVVGVALETVRALEAQMLMRNYKGFLS